MKKGRKDFYCSHRCVGKKHNNHLRDWTNGEENHNHMRGWAGNRRDEYSPFRQTLRSAKARDQATDLTVEGLKALWDGQDGKCAATGIQMLHRGYTKHPYQGSLDRIDGSRGYTLDNVRWVCYIYNIARNGFTDKQVQEFIRAANEKQQP